MFSKAKRVALWRVGNWGLGSWILATLTLSACQSASEDPGLAVARLRGQVSLARSGTAYVLAQPDALILLVKGVELKRFPVRRLWGHRPDAAVSRVVDRIPAVGPPQVTVDAQRAARQFDKVGSVASKDEIVSVQDMPETFLVRFSDGSQWWISSDHWEGPAHAVRKQFLQYRAGFHWLWTRATSPSAKTTIYRVDRPVAQQLFWIIREEMGVIQ